VPDPFQISAPEQRVVLTLKDERHSMGFIDLIVRQDALYPPGRATLLAAGAGITSAIERERAHSHLRRLHALHALHSHRTAELSSEIAERQRTERKLRRFSIAIKQSADAVFIIDTRGIIKYVNKAFEKITGYSRAEAVRRTPRILRSGRHSRSFYLNLWRAIRTGQIYRDMFVNRRKDGAIYYEQVTITPLRENSGVISYFVSTGTDITKHLASEERVNYLVHHDLLTELPTRTLFS